MKKDKITILAPLGDEYNQVCEFSDVRDCCKVVGGLATDINDMLRTGIVKDGEISLDSNGISDPDHIIGRCSDQFDAIEAARAIKKYGQKPKKALKEVSAAVDTAPSVASSPSPSGADSV